MTGNYQQKSYAGSWEQQLPHLILSHSIGVSSSPRGNQKLHVLHACRDMCQNRSWSSPLLPLSFLHAKNRFDGEPEHSGPAWIGWHLAAPAKAALSWQSVSIYWLDVKNLENNFLTRLSPVACNHSAGAFNSPASLPSLSKFCYRGRKRPLRSIRCLRGRKAKLSEHRCREANEEGLTEDSVSCFLWCIDVTQQGRTLQLAATPGAMRTHGSSNSPLFLLFFWSVSKFHLIGDWCIDWYQPACWLK